jgi:hypothetical protein
MNTVRELRRTVEDLNDDLSRQHGRRTPPCEVLHYELGLPQTAAEDAAEKIERARAQELNIEEGNIKLTIEHEELHEALRLFTVDALSQGLDSAQLAARMLTLGRRIGLAEAASILGTEH